MLDGYAIPIDILNGLPYEERKKNAQRYYDLVFGGMTVG
jgi:hypothetical protein